MTLTPLDLTPLDGALQRLGQIEADLGARLLERHETIRAALVALVARRHVALLGPPGTAKSELVTQLAARVAPPGGGGLRTFVRLLTRFTTPEELFGPLSVAGLKNDDYRRITTGMLPEAELAFLDEVFKAGSSLLNALLTLLNERAFDNGATRVAAPLVSLFGASNELPEGEELAALWDRFDLRLVVGYLSDAGFDRLLRLAASAAPPPTLTPQELGALQQAALALPIPDGLLDAVATLRRDLAAKGIAASDRRWRQSLTLLRAHALIEGRGIVEEDDLVILQHVLWSRPDEQREIFRAVARLANPLNGKALELADQAAGIVEQARRDQQGAGSEEERMQVAVETSAKLKGLHEQLSRLHEQASAQGRNPARIAQAEAQVRAQRRKMAEFILG